MKIIKHPVYSTIQLLVLSFISTCLYAEVAASDLVAVTAESKAKCVEYYNRNGILYCSTKALSATPVSPDIVKYEKQQIVFDERPWKFAWGKKADYITTIEYVPMGQDINDWKELVTSQFMGQVPPNISPRSLAERIINDLKKTGFEPIITFHEVTQDKVVFEFRVGKPANQIQDEIQMIKKGNDGVYILHYVIREFDMGKVNRDKWLQNFSKSTIKN